MGYENVIVSNKLRTKHGLHKSREYRIWTSMKQRCYNPDNTAYERYGARGVKVCKRWRDNFDAFYEDMGPSPAGTSLDRINTKGDYTPTNCRWATTKEQGFNRRSNRRITYEGRTMCIAEWAEEYNLPYHVLRYRLRIGWSMKDALSEKSFRGKTCKYKLKYNGKSVSIKEYAELTGTPLQTVYWRYNKGLI